MGRRGRYKAGYYLSLLYVLELQYELEERRRGNDSLKWRPCPRNRPDQFLKWVASCSKLFGAAPPNLGELREHLESNGLGRVGTVLQSVIARHLRKVGRSKLANGKLQDLELPSLEALIELPDAAPEAHPQVRKVASLVGSGLDEKWQRTAASLFGSREFSPALLLGGLPPGFWQLFKVLDTILEREGSPVPGTELTVLQFYGLVTGDLLQPPSAWTPALTALKPIRHEELSSLKSLTFSQMRQLATLDEGALKVLRILRKHRRRIFDAKAVLEELELVDERRLEELLGALQAGSEAAGRLPSTFARWAGHSGDLQQLWRLCQARAHEPLKELDDETWRVVDRGALSLNLLTRLRTWDESLTEQVATTLNQHWVWASLYLDDVAQYTALVDARASAVLHLRELFPRTIGWLDRVSQIGDADGMFEYIDAVAPHAEQHSNAVRAALLS